MMDHNGEITRHIHGRTETSKSRRFCLSSAISVSALWILLGTLIFASQANAKRTNTKIYENIDGSNPCFRRVNGTHEIGCASSSSGDEGVIHVVNDEESLAWVLEKGPSSHSPYVPALYPDYFNPVVMKKLVDSGRIAGVVLLNNTKEKALTEFSTDLKCPNEQFGLQSSAKCEWNKPGSGLLFENFKFPIFFVRDENNVKEIENCYEKFNKPLSDGSSRDWPLCAIQMQSFMFAAVDTPTCLRRSDKFSLSQTSGRVCDPLGDSNLWATLYPTNQSEPYSDEGSVIIVSAKLDAGSMFDALVPGADTAVTGFVTLLTCLKQLSELKDKLMQSGKIQNVYFIIFQGESFGYIGSSKMVYDMKLGNFPGGINAGDKDVPSQLNLTHIKYFIEIGQVALNNEQENYYIHEANSSEISEVTKMLTQEATNVNLSVKLVNQSASTGLPPASLQSFLKERPDLPGMFITNHEKEFRNKFYNSIFDDAAQLGYEYKNITSSSIQSKISKLAAAVSNTVIKLVSSSEELTVKPDPELVDELLHCYMKSANCTLFHKIAPTLHRPNSPLDLYVGVSSYSSRIVTQYTSSLMVYFQGTNLTNITSKEDCKSDNKRTVTYSWLNENCFETTVNSSKAKSPAFEIENYDWKSGNYSTWAESVWSKLAARIYLKPSRLHEILTLVSGIVLFAVSFVVVGWVNSKADIIFPSRPTGLAC